MRIALSTLALPLLLAACSGTDSSPDPGPDATPAPGTAAPVFLSFGTNVGTLTEDEMIVFSAVVTDPDGIDDLIGGTLTSADGAIQYGSFATSGQEGSYTLSLRWAAMQQADDITFKQSVARTFKAVFFDVAGHSVERSAAITLTCGGEFACHGTCAQECGVSSMTREACAGVCARQGMSCLRGVAHYGYPMSLDLSCSAIPQASYFGDAFRELYCACAPNA